MRLGVLDVGSNTVHLLVVDAHRGGHPTPQLSEKSPLKLAQHLDRGGALTEAGADALLDCVRTYQRSARKLGCGELLAFATSAVRDATNSAQVLARVRRETGVDLQVLSGADEARLTFLAARRWYGWSAGSMLMMDIGGGSLELAAGQDEEPEVAVSMPLGAGRLQRERLPTDPPDRGEVDALHHWLGRALTAPARKIAAAGPFDTVVATSKTFRTLARLTGAAPSREGMRAPRQLTLTALRQVTAFLQRMAADDIAQLDGVSSTRAGQIATGALIAQATMTALHVEVAQICPWALREGIILRRLDHLAFA